MTFLVTLDFELLKLPEGVLAGRHTLQVVIGSPAGWYIVGDTARGNLSAA